MLDSDCLLFNLAQSNRLQYFHTCNSANNQLKTGSLESEKIIIGSLKSEKIGSLKSEKIGSLESEKSGPYRSIPGT